MAFAASKCRPARKPLWLNLDETSVGMVFETGQGTVITASTPGGLKEALGVKPSLSERRAAVTFIAMICDQSHVQPRLPQVIVGNKRHFTRKLLTEIAFEKPASVHLLSEVSAWNSSTIMTKVVGLLADALAPFMAEYRPVLLLDCATCHLTPEVLAIARKRDILLVFVPAGATPYLQPLDTTAFKSYKSFLRREFGRLMLESSDGTVPRVAWLRLLIRAATSHLCSKKWAPAFKSAGADAAAGELSSELRRRLPNGLGEALPSGPPTTEQLQQLFPRGRPPPSEELLSLDVPCRRLRFKSTPVK
jgi:hypothetical protein